MSLPIGCIVSAEPLTLRRQTLSTSMDLRRKLSDFRKTSFHLSHRQKREKSMSLQLHRSINAILPSAVCGAIIITSKCS